MKRKLILPTWIRFFSWIFLIFTLTPIIFIIGLFVDINVSLFGIGYYGSSIHPIAIITCAIMGFYAFTAYAILWGKDCAILCGLISGIGGLSMALLINILSMYHGSIYFRLEPLFQIPFIYIMIKKKDEWKNYSHNS